VVSLTYPDRNLLPETNSDNPIMMDDAEVDVLAYMGFPAQHRTKIHSTNPLERLNGEI
jgi:transposase-like protein